MPAPPEFPGVVTDSSGAAEKTGSGMLLCNVTSGYKPSKTDFR